MRIKPIIKMKKNKILTAFAALIAAGSLADAQNLIIRIDDMGALHSVNTASIDTYQNGIAASTEVLVVGGWFPEAVKHTFSSTTLHTMTAKWRQSCISAMKTLPLIVRELQIY